MNPHNAETTPPSVLRFTGSAEEVGVQVWIAMCNPIVRQISNQQEPDVLQQMYAGFLSAAMGSLAADFGQAQAGSIVKDLLEKFNSTDLNAAAKLM